MKSFNLTEWALNHRAVVLFLIVTIIASQVRSDLRDWDNSKIRSSPCRR